MDRITIAQRSENMRRITSKNTSPELRLRKLIRALGISGYRLHRNELPGKPDLAWIGRKIAVFVHGCFWHGHSCKEGVRVPNSNRDYWIAKVERNRARDAKNIRVLRKNGWKVLVIWECEFRQCVKLEKRILRFWNAS